MKRRQILSYIVIASFSFGSLLSLANAADIDLSPEQFSRPKATYNEAIAKQVENNKFVKDGAFTVGITTSSTLPLHDYATDLKTIIGFDIDLAQAIADTMGKKLNIIEVSWADWPLGLSSKKFDAVISNVTVTEERKEKFSFATYRKDVLGVYVAKDSPITQITEPKDISGLKVITDSGTNQEKILLEWNRKNIDNGLKPVDIQYYDDKAMQTFAIESKRADAIFSVNALQSYISKTTGKTKLVGTISGGWPLTADIAVAMPKDSDLTVPMAAIINNLINTGIYTKIIDRWNLNEESIDRSVINPPGLPKTKN